MNEFDSRLTMQQLIHLIHEKHEEQKKMLLLLEARFDGAFPGGDLLKHHGDHTHIHDKDMERIKMLHSLRDKSIVGSLLTIIVFLTGTFVWALLKAGKFL